jgi:hypothetical protein
MDFHALLQLQQPNVKASCRYFHHRWTRLTTAQAAPPPLPPFYT